MAIKGLADLLKKFKSNEIDEVKFEEEFGKNLATEFIPKSKYNELSEAKKVAEKNLESANVTLEELKKNAGLSDEYKKQIEELKSSNSKAQEEYQAQLKKLRIDSAIDSALSNAKARNVKATKALLDPSKILVSDSGEVTGIKEQLDSIVKDNPFLFETQTEDNNPRFGNGKNRGGNDGAKPTLEALMMQAAGLSSSSEK
jgi:hypothetical protein|nr:MAG TPA_asm: minor structural protein [Caudoviricetes sp.]